MALTGIVLGRTDSTGVLVAVPDVEGLARADAEKKLTDFGFKTRAAEVVAEGTAGTVFGQDPAARAVRSKGTTVTLQIVTPAPVPVDIGTQLAAIKAAVDLVETDAKAEDRTNAILSKLDDIRKKLPQGTSKSGPS